MIGCLFPLLLLLIGGAVGAELGGVNGEYWGGGLGFAVGMAMVVALFWMLKQSRHR